MPLPASAPRLGELERTVMDHLWESTVTHPQGSTVREVLARFEGDRSPAYTTVMTVLDRLAKKELVTRERAGRAWRYLPADSREELTARTMRRTLDAMEGSDRRAALLHFLHSASTEELDDLRAALADVEAQHADQAERPQAPDRIPPTSPGPAADPAPSASKTDKIASTLRRLRR